MRSRQARHKSSLDRTASLHEGLLQVLVPQSHRLDSVHRKPGDGFFPTELQAPEVGGRGETSNNVAHKLLRYAGAVG
eukprot:10235810-Prorocentrum_lima.AAC.1